MWEQKMKIRAKMIKLLTNAKFETWVAPFIPFVVSSLYGTAAIQLFHNAGFMQENQQNHFVRCLKCVGWLYPGFIPPTDVHFGPTGSSELAAGVSISLRMLICLVVASW